jgi:hypothetical protein
MAQIIKFLVIIALIVSFFWFFSDPGFEPALACIGSILALMPVVFVEKRNKQSAQQYQAVSKSSMGIQAGGNVSIGDINRDKDAQ